MVAYWLMVSFIMLLFLSEVYKHKESNLNMHLNVGDHTLFPPIPVLE